MSANGNVGHELRQASACLRVASVAVALWLAAAIGARAQQPVTMSAATAGRVDAAVKDAQQRLKIPGLTVAVGLNGTVVYDKAFGLADVENNLPATPESRFRTASIVKMVTATAVMQLVERGQLDLDATIQAYCPAFPKKEWPVTARQLLGHMGGVRHYAKQGESTGTAHFFSISDSLALFKNDPLRFQPGTRYEYTTFGFSVIGCAVEGASKTSYEQFVLENIAKPAGMSHTAVDDLYQIVPGRVRGYQMLTEDAYKQLPPAVQAIAKPNTVYNASLHDTSMKIPGGGWVSTASDMARFGMAMLQGTLVKPATRDQMWTSQKTPDGKETGYGFGSGVQTRDGLLVISHSGNQAGASSAIRISPNRQAVVVVMTNLEDAPVGEIVNAVIAALNR